MDVLQLIVVVLITIYIIKVYNSLQHWKRKNVKHTKGIPVFGSMYKVILGKKSYMQELLDQYNAFPNERYNGLYSFTRPAILIKDLDLIKQIIVKDFDHFINHELHFNPEVDPHMALSLFFLQDQKWKDTRSAISPVFTSSKFKGTYELITKCSEQFTQYFLHRGTKIISLEMKDTFARFATDVIATAAFGIECNSLKDKENIFYKMGKVIVDFSSIGQIIKFIIFGICPKIQTIFDLPLVDRKHTNYFKNIILNTMKERENGNILRPDLIGLLMDLKKGKLRYEEQSDVSMGFANVEESEVGRRKVDIDLSDDLMVAQALVFFFAGFETMSNMLSFCIYELAMNTDIQKRLREEIDEVFRVNDGKVPYGEMVEMKYLDMVLSESLRKWPTNPHLDRICNKNYMIQPQGDEELFMFEKGEVVLIPVIGIHRDPKYYPNPDKFDPERFSDENKDKILPYSYMPFGVGPRNCIGSRFALMEAKIILIHLLSKFEIVPTDKTPTKPTITGDFSPKIQGGIWVGLKRRCL